MLNNFFFFFTYIHEIFISHVLYTEQVRRNQIDDVLNISTPTACQDAETVAAATAAALVA
jgi:hypothetical protein